MDNGVELMVLESGEQLRWLLTQARLAKGIHQGELGASLGYGGGGQQRVSCVERGYTGLNVEKLLVWAEALDLEVLVRAKRVGATRPLVPTRGSAVQSLIDDLTPRQVRTLEAIANAFRGGLPHSQAKALETMAAAFEQLSLPAAEEADGSR